MTQVTPFHPPTAFADIVDEIVGLSGIPRDEVERRVWRQVTEPGSSVLEDVVNFGVTPHEYNDRMLDLYRLGTGFIYETMVYAAKPTRSRWTYQALERILLHLERTGSAPAQARMLILGDGSGNDSLFFATRGIHVHYFDVPGSRTYKFAMNRFAKYGLLGDAIQAVPDYDSCLQGHYDIVLCFDVLEHLPEPLQAIRDIGRMLKGGGIALITEDFGDLAPHLPTHLRLSKKLAGTTPFLFLDAKMVLSWYSLNPPLKPMEFTRVDSVSTKDRWRLWRDPHVRGMYLHTFAHSLAKQLYRLAHLGG